jgi:hypothetical protein
MFQTNLYYPEDGGGRLLRNGGTYLHNYTAYTPQEHNLELKMSGEHRARDASAENERSLCICPPPSTVNGSRYWFQEEINVHNKDALRENLSPESGAKLLPASCSG